MKIKVIVVGKTKENFLNLGEEEYRRRLKRYLNLEWIIVRPEKISARSNEAKVKAIEGQRITEKIEAGEWIIVLDRNGQAISSEQLADFFLKQMQTGMKCTTFIIGGTLGLSEDLFQMAKVKLSLSPMTFTHEMTRLILLEQIYRAFTIIKGEKYHK